MTKHIKLSSLKQTNMKSKPESCGVRYHVSLAHSLSHTHPRCWRPRLCSINDEDEGHLLPVCDVHGTGAKGHRKRRTKKQLTHATMVQTHRLVSIPLAARSSNDHYRREATPAYIDIHIV
jgi:hypothetical protein